MIQREKEDWIIFWISVGLFAALIAGTVLTK